MPMFGPGKATFAIEQDSAEGGWYTGIWDADGDEWTGDVQATAVHQIDEGLTRSAGKNAVTSPKPR